MERIKVFWTSNLSENHMEPRGDKEFKEAVRNVQNGPKQPNWQKRVIFKGDGSLRHFFSRVMGENSCGLDSSHVRVANGTN